MQNKIKVIVNGAYGKMGKATVNAVSHDPALELVAQCGHQDNLALSIKNTGANVVVDFTTPDAVFQNSKIIIECGAHPVIGTTGLTQDQIQTLQTWCNENQRGGIIAPNFSIGAILMMKMSALAAKYFNQVEIIELHHDKKKDSPSGTAIKTAEMITAAKQMCTVNPNAPARGISKDNIQIHSVRLPGLMANQQVIFGAPGETLTIRHDTIDRECFMPGVIMSCKKVIELKSLIYGLDRILF